MKNLKKLLSLVLALVMCLSLVNLSAFAEENGEIESIAVIAVYEGYKLVDMAREQITNYDELGITMPSLDDDGWAQIDSTAFVDGTVKLLFCIHVQGDTPNTPYIVTSDKSEWVGGAPMEGNLPDEPTSSDPFKYGADIFVTKTFSESDIVPNDYGDWLGNFAEVNPHQTDEDASGEWDWVRVNAKATLTYDANAGEDEVTGLPKAQTVDKGAQVHIANYRSMKREGYKIYGWSTDPKATFPDTSLTIGSSYTLDKDTTFYAVWEKNEEPDPEVPDGATLKTITIKPSFYVKQQDGTYAGMQGVPAVQYDYSYEYGGQTYTGTTAFEKHPLGGTTNNQVLKVLVSSKGEPTKVNLTLKAHEVAGYTWFQQQMNYTASSWECVSKTPAAWMNVTAQSSASVLSYNYYNVDGDEPEDGTVTYRDVDVVASFEMPDNKAITLDKVPEDFAVTYSYEDIDGNTVTQTLERKDAKETQKARAIIELQDEKYVVLGFDKENPYYYLEWTITVPVIGDGIYLSLGQKNYEITEKPYVWDSVKGVQTFGSDGANLGRWYVSKGNNPVSTYIYNVYTKEYTVTYTDGVEGAEIFADQAIKAKEGSPTPTIADPTREGYTFNGWSPAVAETVTEDVTYVAQWTANGGGGGGSTSYTLTYNANGGSGAPRSQSGSGSITLRAEEPTREGYTFEGWATSRNATEAAYQPGGSYNLTRSVILYAVWSTSIEDPDTPTTDIPDDDVPLANVDGLNNTDHFAYIIGRGNNGVQPMANTKLQ